MRAHPKGKHDIGRRFAIVIAVATVSVMALGTQAAAAPGVVKYDTTLTITREGGAGGPDAGACHAGQKCVLWHGGVNSEVRKCEEGRRVVLFKKRSGADRKLGADRTDRRGDWGLNAPQRGRSYAKVKRKVGDRYVCLADRSPTDK